MSTAILKAINFVGGQTALAKKCMVSQPTVNQWSNGGKMDVKYIPRIIQATNGEVTARDLRPDVDWDTIKASL